MFPQRQLTIIKNRLDIVDVVGQHLTLHKKGNSYVGLCPFHADRHPSLSVNSKKQIFKCFSCNVAGDIFQFWSRFHKVDFAHAVAALAQRAGIKITTNATAKPDWTSQQQQIFAINMDFTRYCFNFLFSKNDDAQNARAYLQQRRIERQTMVHFKLGLCPAQEQIITFLTEQGYTLTQLHASGLVLIVQDRPFCPFAGRITLPIFNTWGQVVGFSGRSRKPDEAKYINSPHTAVFEKHAVLYNWAVTAQARPRSLVVCEGGFDVIALTQAGVKNCVGLLGTSLSAEQVKLIVAQKCRVLLWLDADEAGQTATINLAHKLLMAHVQVRVYAAKTHQSDPASVVSEKQFSVDQLGSGWQHPVSFAIRVFQSALDLQQAESVQRFIKRVTALLQLETDQVILNSFVQQLSVITKLSPAVIKETMQMQVTPAPNRPKTSADPSQLQRAERRLLWLACNDRQNFQAIMAMDSETKFSVPYLTVWNALHKYYVPQSTAITNVVDLSHQQQIETFGVAITRCIDEIFQQEQNPYRTNNHREIQDCLLIVEKHKLELQVRMSKEKKRNAQDPSTKIALSKRIVKLRQKVVEQDLTKICNAHP